MEANTATEHAITFICKRNPLDEIDQHDFVFMLMEFQDIHGDEAVQGLAGFYCYAIDKIGGRKGSEAIQETFRHDLYGRKEKGMLPRSADYIGFWRKELERGYYKLAS